jgi:asparaginyl-tRNA synthetase|tara:strand:- start:2494 stop:3903 length:1410 start_codon:yes stop_codon:yes gene_type:complete
MSIAFQLSRENENEIINVYGWVRTLRSSGTTLGFCNINDGSNVNGVQIIISEEFIGLTEIDLFFKKVYTGSYLNCYGKLVKSPAKGQEYELLLYSYKVVGDIDPNQYPLVKGRMNLDTLRNHIHLRSRTNVFGSVFRIRSTLMKILHDFYHSKGYLHLDPNIITTNECEGGAGVFQITEKDITNIDKLEKTKDGKYDWSTDHFTYPTFLTVSSQLQLEAMACSLGNVYTINKSFRSEHSLTSKHVSEFTHLEIEIINNTLDDLMNVGEEMIKYSISEIFKRSNEDIENLNKFISKGIVEKLTHLRDCEYKRLKYDDVIKIINDDIKNNKIKLDNIKYGDDLGSKHENYITEKYKTPVFVTHWPMDIKSFYMKQCNDGTCECFDLLMPYGIGELIGASQREDSYGKLKYMMKQKNVDEQNMEFYLDLRKYGSCPHGGFGLGFDRLLMLITGITNIKDVIPFPVSYKSCKY